MLSHSAGRRVRGGTTLLKAQEVWVHLPCVLVCPLRLRRWLHLPDLVIWISRPELLLLPLKMKKPLAP